MARSGYLPEGLFTGGGLVFGGAAVAQGAVQVGAVVPADVLHDRTAGPGPGGPGADICQLAFERGEERLGEGVVPALASAPEGQGDLAVTGQGGELGRGVLAAAVGVKPNSV